MNRTIVAVALLVSASCGKDDGHGTAAHEAERTLHVFVWTDYLVPDVVSAFETEFHCRVAQANFDSNETLRAKLLAGDSGYDLVCPSDYMVTQLVKDGLLADIDLARVPNVKHLGARFRESDYDPGHRHSIPYQWGLTGVAYRRSDVKDPPRSWKDFFDATKSAAWKGRVSLLDDGREVLAAALLALGHAPNTRDEKEIAAARDLVAKLKPSIAKFDSNNYGASLAAKELLVAQGWSGDVAKAQVEDPDIAFVVPEEGTLAYVDNWAIPKSAPQKTLAEDFIDFLLRPDVAAKAANEHRYASVNEAAKPMILPEILTGTAYEDGRGKKLFRVEDVGSASAAYARAWSDLKTQ